MSERILITGASGNVGTETINALTTRKTGGYEVLAGVRHPAEDRAGVPDSVTDLVRLDFTNPRTFDTALEGIDRVLLVRPPQLADVAKYFAPFVAAMQRAGTKQVVFLSLQGVENNPLTPHAKIETLITEAGLPYTFLRPSFFMQNLSTTHRKEIRERNEIFVPAGKGKTSFIDVRDIGAVAALTLTSTGHINKAYELTGSEALSYYEIADILSDVLDRKITYTDPSIFRFVWRKRIRENVSLGFVLIMVALYSVAKAGRAAGLTDEIQRLLDRAPIAFRQFAEDYRQVWK
ncbi:NmrA family NAD(P)-binding protein [Nibrella viscosa]|uniref:NmrA family NAD(P)-binding protein n=1 Tax=Nibrella viscosa TaxID=1084524 RepID=A0ABP8KDQ1_9BACT